MVGGGVKEVTLTHANASGRQMFLFKICMIGTENVGKTCFIKRFVNQKFDENYSATIGVDFATKTIEIGRDDLIKLQVWDTAGQERFRAITNTYYRGAHGIILMYDVTNRVTFEALPNWLDTINQVAHEDRIVVIVGNKADAAGESRQVSSEEGRQFAQKENMMFFESSARDDSNVTNVYQELCEMLLAQHKDKSTKCESTAPGPSKSTTSEPVTLKKQKKEKEKHKKEKEKKKKDKGSKLCLI